MKLITNESIKIINTHLFGGRIDDRKITNKKFPYNIRDMMMQKLIDENPDIIAGDFNSDKNGNEARLNADYWNKISLNNILGQENALKFLKSPHELLKEKKFMPVVDNLVSTTPFDITADWIYMNFEKNYKVLASGVIETGASKGIQEISDHDFIYCILEA